MKAAKEAMETLYNELSNSKWVFDGQGIANVQVDSDRRQIQVHLADHRIVSISFLERPSTDSGYALCTVCMHIKPGWPDLWRNIAGKGLRYACADCVAKSKEKDNG